MGKDTLLQSSQIENQFDLESLRQAYRREATMGNIGPAIVAQQQIRSREETAKAGMEQQQKQFDARSQQQQQQFDARLALQQKEYLDAHQMAIEQHKLNVLKQGAIQQKMILANQLAETQRTVAQNQLLTTQAKLEREKLLNEQEEKYPRKFLSLLGKPLVGPDGKTMQQLVPTKKGIEVRQIEGLTPKDYFTRYRSSYQAKGKTATQKLKDLKSILAIKYNMGNVFDSEMISDKEERRFYEETLESALSEQQGSGVEQKNRVLMEIRKNLQEARKLLERKK